MGNKISYGSRQRNNSAVGRRKVTLRQVARTQYRGTTRSRDTQAAPHPMRTVRTTLGSLRSSNPAIRRAAQTAALRLGLIERADGTREG